MYMNKSKSFVIAGFEKCWYGWQVLRWWSKLNTENVRKFYC